MYFSFVYPNWLKSFKDKDFTTFLKNEEMYAAHMTYLFSELIPKVSEEWVKNRQNPEFRHCHKIEQEGRSVGKYKKAIRKLHPQISTDSLEIWQFGFKGHSIRLICHKESSSNILIPLLIDQHHLGSDDVHHNQPDYNNYNFCPMAKYGDN